MYIVDFSQRKLLDRSKVVGANTLVMHRPSMVQASMLLGSTLVAVSKNVSAGSCLSCIVQTTPYSSRLQEQDANTSNEYDVTETRFKIQ